MCQNYVFKCDGFIINSKDLMFEFPSFLGTYLPAYFLRVVEGKNPAEDLFRIDNPQNIFSIVTDFFSFANKILKPLNQ